MRGAMLDLLGAKMYDAPFDDSVTQTITMDVQWLTFWYTRVSELEVGIDFDQTVFPFTHQHVSGTVIKVDPTGLPLTAGPNEVALVTQAGDYRQFLADFPPSFGVAQVLNFFRFRPSFDSLTQLWNVVLDVEFFNSGAVTVKNQASFGTSCGTLEMTADDPVLGRSFSESVQLFANNPDWNVNATLQPFSFNPWRAPGGPDKYDTTTGALI